MPSPALLVICPIRWRSSPLLGHEEPFLTVEWALAEEQVGENSALVEVGNQVVVYRWHAGDGVVVHMGEATLREMLSDVGVSETWAAQVGVRAHDVPLWLHVQVEGRSWLYSCVTSHWSSLLFLQTGSYVPDVGGGDDSVACYALRVRDQALQAHAKWRLFLNNHNNFNFYQKYRPDDEMEYKYTLAATADTWQLAARLYHQLAQGMLPGYMLHFAHPVTHWDFDNYVFEISAPPEERGYISFLPTASGTFIIKRKVYAEDALIRQEFRMRDVVIEGTFEAYLRDQYPTLVHRRLPAFRRVRYDVDVESLTTGNIFCIMFDRSTVMGVEWTPLVQCEVEYLQTRSCYPPRAVLDELADVSAAIHDFLIGQDVQPVATYYSKLTYLQACVAANP